MLETPMTDPRAFACTATLKNGLAENKAMLGVFARSGFPMRTRREDGAVHVTLSLCGEPG